LPTWRQGSITRPDRRAVQDKFSACAVRFTIAALTVIKTRPNFMSADRNGDRLHEMRPGIES
jgi:hypothetical protein